MRTATQEITTSDIINNFIVNVNVYTNPNPPVITTSRLSA